MTPTTITACLDLADRTLGEIMRSAVDPNGHTTAQKYEMIRRQLAEWDRQSP